ncbi:MAG: 30S ribosomal protein S2 [Phycisphaerae bacterium]|nr:30S ribosomal protein S2 [Phycisphaerae bacterium]
MSEMVQELIDAGIHYGHRASRWNPKMKPYIYGKRNNLHIIDVKETLRGLLLAKKFIAQTVSRGKDVVFIGTKRQARKSVQKHADRVEMHWVNDRWLGGTLTNFREIRKRVGRLDQLEQMEAEGLLDAYSKKEGSSLRREMRKIRKNLGGIRKMTKQPGVMIVVDSQREHIAVREARKMGIPVIALLDTDADPDPIDIPIPGNDDAMRAIEVVIRELADAVEIGKHSRVETDADGEKSQPRRRSRRATTARAEDEATETQDASAGETAATPEPTSPTPEPAPAPAAEENA